MISKVEFKELLERYTPITDPKDRRRNKDKRAHVRQFFIFLVASQKDGSEEQLGPEYMIEFCDYLCNKHDYQPRSIHSKYASVHSWMVETFHDKMFWIYLHDYFATKVRPDAPSTGKTRKIFISYGHNHIDSELEWLRTKATLWAGLNVKAKLPPLVSEESGAGFCPSHAHAQMLIDQLNLRTRHGLRDAAIIGNMLFLGLRPSEICALDVEDVVLKGSETTGSYLRIPKKPGCTPRDIPYDEFSTVSELTQLWKRAAQIDQGPLFRGFYRGYSTVRPEQLSTPGIDRILANYPISVEGKLHTLTPLELRRFSARLLAQKGCSLSSMCQRLGVAKAQTVLNYLDGDLPEHFEKSKQIKFQLDRLSGYEDARDRWG